MSRGFSRYQPGVLYMFVGPYVPQAPSTAIRPSPATTDRWDIKTPPKQLSFWQVTGPAGGQQSLLPPPGRQVNKAHTEVRLGGAVRQRAAVEFDRFAAETGTVRPPQRARLLRRGLRRQHQGQ